MTRSASLTTRSGAHTHCDPAGIHTHCAAAQDDHICLGCSGDAREQDSLAAETLLQVFRALLDGKTSGNLAHRRQAGKGTVLFLHCLICHSLHFSRQQGIRLGLVRRQMKICIQDQSVVEKRIFLFQRLFDLDHHFAGAPHICCLVDHRGTRLYIFLIRKAGACTGALLNQHFMARRDICAHIIRSKSHSEFIVFNFFHTSDLHVCNITSFYPAHRWYIDKSPLRLRYVSKSRCASAPPPWSVNRSSPSLRYVGKSRCASARVPQQILAAPLSMAACATALATAGPTLGSKA